MRYRVRRRIVRGSLPAWPAGHTISEGEARNLRRFPLLLQDGWLVPEPDDTAEQEGPPEAGAETSEASAEAPPEQGTTVAELRETVPDMDRAEAEAALEAEREGRNRSGAIEVLEAHLRRLDREAEEGA